LKAIRKIYVITQKWFDLERCEVFDLLQPSAYAPE